MISKDVAADGHLHDGPPLPGHRRSVTGRRPTCAARGSTSSCRRCTARCSPGGTTRCSPSARCPASPSSRRSCSPTRPAPRWTWCSSSSTSASTTGRRSGTSAPLRLRDLKASFGRWQAGLADVGWNSLYWDNHDQPRAVSRFGDDAREFRRDSATCLATLLHLHRGTPYVYQGEEIGHGELPVRLASTTSGTSSRSTTSGGDGRGRGPGRRAGGAAPDEPGQRADAGAVGRVAVTPASPPGRRGCR